MQRDRGALLAVLWLSNMIQLALRYSWGMVLPQASRQLGLSGLEAGAIMASFYAGYIIAGVPSGYLVDRVGARTAAGLSLVSLAAVSALIGLSRSFVELFVAFFAAGVLAGPVFPSSLKVVSESLEGHRRATGIGALETVAPIAFLASSLAFPPLTYKIGWNYVYIAISASSLAVAPLYFALVPRTGRGRTGHRPSLIGTLRNFEVVKGALTRLGGMWGLGILTWYYYIETYTGMGAAYAQLVLVVFSAFAVAGQFLGGVLSDRWLAAGRKRLAAAGLLAFSASLILIRAADPGWGTVAVAALAGFTAYFWKAGLDAHIMEAASSTGTASGAGLMNTVSQAGSLSPVAVGASIDAFGVDSIYPLVLLAAGPLMSFAVLAAERNGRRHAGSG
ncbi:MAG: MFS transporter [Conexivisphaera sp.]